MTVVLEVLTESILRESYPFNVGGEMNIVLSVITVFFLFTNAGTGYAQKRIPVSLEQEITRSARVAFQLLKEYKVNGVSALTPYIDEFSKITIDVCQAMAPGDVYLGEEGESFSLILDVLAFSGDPRALPALIEMLSNPHVGSRHVDEGIANMRKSSVDELMKPTNLNKDSYKSAVETLCLMKESKINLITPATSTAIVTKIRTLLDNDDEQIKYISVRALRSFGDSSDVPKLLELKEKTTMATMSSTSMRDLMLTNINETLGILQK